MTFRFYTLCLFMLTVSFVSAQFSPVSWSQEAEKISDTEYNLVFTAEIQDGWYVYSQFLDDGGPVPTTFTFTSDDGITMLGKLTETGDNKKDKFDDIFGMQLIKYGDEVKFIQKIQVSSTVKSVKGYLTYMTCNNESCLPPKDIDFEISLN